METREGEFDAEARSRGDRSGENMGGRDVLDSVEDRGRGFDGGL